MPKLSDHAQHLRNVLAPEAAATATNPPNTFAEITPENISIKAIKMASNVRRSMDPLDLQELQASLRRYGMLQPVIVQPIPGKRAGHRYQLIAGFRRVTAAKALGWVEVPAQVLDRALAPRERVAVQLTENMQRETMRIRDIVISIQTLRDDQMSLQNIAETLGLGVSTVRLYAQLGTILDSNPRLWPYFDKGLISIEQFRAAYRLLTKLREKAGERIQDPVKLEEIHGEAEELFAQVLERLAKTQPLTVKRVTQEVSRWLTTLGVEPPPEKATDTVHSPPFKAALASYVKLDLSQLNAGQLEEFINLTEQKLDAAKAQLEQFA